jgi:hypothetical protein
VKTVKINARLTSTETGEVFAAASVEVVKDETVSSLMVDGEATSTNVRPTPSPTPLSTAKVPPSRTIESHLFTFDLQVCRPSGSSVVCDFVITNNDRDRRLGIMDWTRLFDDSGREVRPREIRIAEKVQGQFMSPPLLISGVKTKSRVVFEGVSPNATKATKLNVQFSGEAGRFEIDYRDVPLR